MKDGRDRTKPYRVRTGGVWYWVDPAVPLGAIGPGDTVVVYPVGGEAVVAVMEGQHGPSLSFASLDGKRFDAARSDIAAVHLAAVDNVQ